MTRLLLALAVLIGSAIMPAAAACTSTNSYVIKDGNIVAQQMAATILPDCRVVPNHVLTDPTGNPYTAGNPLPTQPAAPAAGEATSALQSQIDADLRTTLPRAIASNAPAKDGTGTLSASGDTVSVLANGMNTGLVRLPTGWTGTVVVEGTADGTNYDVPLPVQLYSSAGNTGALATLTSGGVYEGTSPGLAGGRVRATSASGGGPSAVRGRAATGNKASRGGAPAGAPVPTAPAALSPTEGATTSQSLASLSVVASRAAEPASLGQWYAQNQSGSIEYLAFFAADGVTRLATIAIGPGTGQGAQGGDASFATTFGAFRGPMTLYGASGAQSTLARQ